MFKMTRQQVETVTLPFKLITPIALSLLTIVGSITGFFATRYLDAILGRIDKISSKMDMYIEKSSEKIDGIEHRVTVLENKK